MPDAPPAIIILIPGVPPAFRIETIDPAAPATPDFTLVQPDCPLSDFGDIVVCGRRAAKRNYRIEAQLPPPPTTMGDINEALTLRWGSAEIGLSGLKLKF